MTEESLSETTSDRQGRDTKPLYKKQENKVEENVLIF